jgi:EmrB/QacA subfamily drug resistance transporter
MSETVPVNSSNGVERLTLKGPGVILIILAFIAMMVMFIEIMLVPALPTIAMEFPDESQWVSWVLSAYLLTGAVATPLLGRLGDIYGKKKVMMLSMVGYTIGLVGCAFSTSMVMLIAFRSVQGIGMGMFPLAFGIIRDNFPKRLIPAAIGVVSAMFSVGVSIGLLAGGLIVEYFDWRTAFDIVWPLMALLTVVVYFVIKTTDTTIKCKIDVAGAALLGLGIFCLLLGLTQGDEWGWTSIGVIGLFALSASLLIGFVLWERRTTDPIVSLRLMANRGIAGANICGFFVGISMFLIFQTLPFFLMSPEEVGGLGVESAFDVGVYLFPSAIAQLIFAPLAGKWSKKLGADRVLATGLLFIAFGYLLVILFHSNVNEIMIAMFVMGIGLGVSMVSLINVVAMASPQRDFGIASGMNTLFRIVGGSIGPVLASVILAGYLIAYNPPGAPPSVIIELTSDQGYVWAWIAGMAFSLVGFVIALVMRPGHGLDYENDVRPEDEIGKTSCPQP